LYRLARKLLFQFSAETAHQLTLEGLSVAARLNLVPTLMPAMESLPVTVMGLEFPNPVGLAAGLDKDGEYIDGLASLGFGFLEIGTVTPKPQLGNLKPRMFRLPEAQAIINRMGFNNAGVDCLVRNIKRARFAGVLGINIGKNLDTPMSEAIDDYISCMDKVYNWASYIVINISSPNTPGLRNLQYGEQLQNMLGGLKQQQRKLHLQYGYYVPLAVKIAPDMTACELQQVARCLLSNQVDGVIATNTTVVRNGVESMPYADEAGGLSGAPLLQRSTDTIRELSTILNQCLPIIGVGGICSEADAIAKLAAGASLVQLYSGLVYQGPALIGRSVRALASHIRS
jgi:dihydroorotate dehydrogenase